MDALLALPYPITVSVHAAPVAKSAALSNLDKRKSQMNLGKKEFNSQTNEEIRELRDIVESGKESLVQTEFGIFLNLSDKAKIQTAVQDVYGVLGKYGVRPVLEEQLVLPKFWGQAPPHCVVFASTGSGKTVFKDLVGGTYHQISHDGEISLNPFDCGAGEATTLNLFMQILTNAETEKEKKDIRIFVSEMMKQPRFNRRMDWYANELAPHGRFREKLEKWIKGDTLNAKLFNGNRDTLDVSKKRLNVFGLDNVKDDANAAAALFFYLFKKIERNAQSGRPSLLIVDEAPTLLSSQPLKSEIEKLLKTARKQRMAIFMAFQGTNDLKTLNIKETILTNCHTRFFYDGCAGTPEEIDGFNLTESETDFVLTKGAKIEGAKRPVLMQRNGVNVFLETDMSCLGNYLNAFKGGAKAVRFLDYAKLFKPEDPAAYYLKHYGENR